MSSSRCHSRYRRLYSTALASLLALAFTASIAGCGEDEEEIVEPPDSTVPTTYTFESKFNAGESSVSYSGQVFRQVLIRDMKAYISALTDRIDGVEQYRPTAQEIVAGLNFYYLFDGSASGDIELLTDTTGDLPLAQGTYNDIATGKDLKSKLAGNDTSTDHVDWSSAFTGWTEGGASNPDALLQYWFGQLGTLAEERGVGTVPDDPTGASITKVFITPQGQDLVQLIQKFLLSALTFSQGADDYLDDDVDGKGLLSPNEQHEGDRAYTTLEHQWDEGFGYFGAARNYNEYTDEELAANGGRPAFQYSYNDADGDGQIDLLSEFNLGMSLNAGKRDLASSTDAPTDFSAQIFDAFLAGRHIIASADGPLTDDQLADLRAQRDIVVHTWESTFAATIIHYANETLGHMDDFGAPEYDFADHAKHWSELKGFALSLQFNPHKRISDAQFEMMHMLIGDAPILPNAEQTAIDDYRAGLEQVRTMLGEIYDFDPANVNSW